MLEKLTADCTRADETGADLHATQRKVEVDQDKLSVVEQRICAPEKGADLAPSRNKPAHPIGAQAIEMTPPLLPTLPVPAPLLNNSQAPPRKQKLRTPLLPLEQKLSRPTPGVAEPAVPLARALAERTTAEGSQAELNGEGARLQTRTMHELAKKWKIMGRRGWTLGSHDRLSPRRCPAEDSDAQGETGTSTVFAKADGGQTRTGILL